MDEGISFPEFLAGLFDVFHESLNGIRAMGRFSQAF